MPIRETNEGVFYRYEDEQNPNRKAAIYFHKLMGDNKWTFERSEIHLLQTKKDKGFYLPDEEVFNIDSIEDWKFLFNIAEEIDTRLEELNE